MPLAELFRGPVGLGRALGWAGGIYGVVVTVSLAVIYDLAQSAGAVAFIVACALGYALSLYLVATRRRVLLGALVPLLVLLNVVSLPSIGLVLLPGTALLGLAVLIPWPDGD